MHKCYHGGHGVKLSASVHIMEFTFDAQDTTKMNIRVGGVMADAHRDINVTHCSKCCRDGGCWTAADTNDAEYWLYNVVYIAGGVIEVRNMSWSKLISNLST